MLPVVACPAPTEREPHPMFHAPGLARLPAALALLLSLGGAVQAQDLRIAMKAAVDGADPHQLFTPNRNVQLHVYEALVAQDAKLRPTPGLAESWRATDPTTWEFRLREGVLFQDGTPLTAEDAAFSIRRAQTAEGVRTFRAYVKDITAVEVVDARTLRIRTDGPQPELPANLATIAIVSARAVEGASAEDFNGGRAAIGTGPYRWLRWTPGQDVVLERNPRYRGEAPPWSRVTFRFVPNDSARTAALLAGDVDVADAVPAGLHQRVRESDNAHLQTGTSLFMLYMTVDRRPTSPFVRDKEGRPMTVNPFNDARVRQAFTHAINRPALAERAMEGAAEPAGQFMPDGFDGHDPGLKPVAYDPALSRRLLREAGYPEGFNYTIHCLNDRFTGDVRTCQAVGQMLTAAGIRTQVEAMPSAMFFKRATGPEPEFSSYMAIFGSAAGLASNALNVLAQRWDPKAGTGRSNSGRYDNPALNALIEKAAATLDEDARQDLLRQATRIAVEDQAVLPIFFLKGAWGLRNGLAMQTRGDMYTMATAITPAR